MCAHCAQDLSHRIPWYPCLWIPVQHGMIQVHAPSSLWSGTSDTKRKLVYPTPDWKLWPKVYLFMAKSYFLRISALRISALRGCFEVAKKFGTHRQMHRSRTKQRPPSPTVQNATDEKKNKKRKRKILKKKRKTKRLPRAVDDSARGQRPRKRRPKA